MRLPRRPSDHLGSPERIDDDVAGPGATHARRPGHLPAPWLGLLVAVGALVAILLQAAQDDPHPGGPEQTSRTLTVSQPESHLEVLIGRLDGAFSFELALDPTLELFRSNTHGDDAEVAYRAGRPLTGWLAWILSLGGRRVLVGPALVIITAASIGGTVWAVQWATAPTRARFPAAAALMPGTLIAIIAPGLCDQPATCLAVAGVAAHRHAHRRAAVALLTAAALTRESTMLVAGAITLVGLWHTRSPRALLPTVVPLGAFVAWNVAVRLMVGASILDADEGALTAPASGLLDGAGLWTTIEVGTALAVGVSFVLLLAVSDQVLRTVAVVHLAFAVLMAEIVWKVWWGFGRVLLPIQVLALVAFTFLQRRAAPAAGGLDDAPAG